MNYKPIVVSVVSIGLFVIGYHYGNQIALKPYSSRLMIAAASSDNHKLPDSNDKSVITSKSSTLNKNRHSKPFVDQPINTHDDSKHTSINNNTSTTQKTINSVDGNKSATSRYFKTGLNGKTTLDQKIISECIYQHHLSYSSHDIHDIKKLMSIKHLTVKQSVKQYFKNK